MGVENTVYDLPQAERPLAAIAAQAAAWRREADNTGDQWTREDLTAKADIADMLITAGLRGVYPRGSVDYIAERVKALAEATTLFTLTWAGNNGQQTRVGDRRRIEQFARLLDGAGDRGTAWDIHVADAAGSDVTGEFFPEVAA